MVNKTIRTLARESRGRDAADTLRWSVERRLAFIDDRLFWLGEVNRTDLVERFGVSLGQASADIARYLARGPKGVSYDKSAKCYVADASFRPLLAPPDAARFLSELRLLDAGLLPLEDTLLRWVPPFDAAPLPQRKVDPLVLRAVLACIRNALTLEIVYQSMNRAEPTRRLIEPHALTYDGFRWHARAFDHDQGDFRDFVLGRMSKPRLHGPARSKATSDEAWRSFVDLEIAPHPGLTQAQAKAIALDYGLGKGKAAIKVRRALLFYALRRLGLDVDPNVRPPREQHIVLVNRSEINAWLAAPADDA